MYMKSPSLVEGLGPIFEELCLRVFQILVTLKIMATVTNYLHYDLYNDFFFKWICSYVATAPYNLRH